MSIAHSFHITFPAIPDLDRMKKSSHEYATSIDGAGALPATFPSSEQNFMRPFMKRNPFA